MPAWLTTLPGRLAVWAGLLVAGALAVLAALSSAERRGEQRERARGQAETLNARTRADAAAADYRGDGGASGRLRDGTF